MLRLWGVQGGVGCKDGELVLLKGRVGTGLGSVERCLGSQMVKHRRVLGKVDCRDFLRGGGGVRSIKI